MQWRSGGLQLRDVCSGVSLLLLLLMLFVLLLVLLLVLLVIILELIFFRLLARVVWGHQIVEQLSTRASRQQVSRTLILAVTSATCWLASCYCEQALGYGTNTLRSSVLDHDAPERRLLSFLAWVLFRRLPLAASA